MGQFQDLLQLARRLDSLINTAEELAAIFKRYNTDGHYEVSLKIEDMLADLANAEVELERARLLERKCHR